MAIRAECVAGYGGEPTPHAFVLQERRVEVREVLDRWLARDHRYFKVRGDDGGIYILRHDWTPETGNSPCSSNRDDGCTSHFGGGIQESSKPIASR